MAVCIVFLSRNDTYTSDSHLSIDIESPTGSLLALLLIFPLLL